MPLTEKTRRLRSQWRRRPCRTVGVKIREIEDLKGSSWGPRSQFVLFIKYRHTRIGIAYIGAACGCRYITIDNVYGGRYTVIV